MTLSIAGRCARTGQFGVAISSSSPAVAARCAWARAGVGAACTQNITDPRLGMVLLERMGEGKSAKEMASVTAEEPLIAWRQLTAIDRDGVTAAWSGAQTLGTYATAEGPDCVAAGNLSQTTTCLGKWLKHSRVYPTPTLPDASRPSGGLRAGGEAGPVHSAGLIVVSDVPWPVTDLRVDWSEE